MPRSTRRSAPNQPFRWFGFENKVLDTVAHPLSSDSGPQGASDSHSNHLRSIIPELVPGTLSDDARRADSYFITERAQLSLARLYGIALYAGCDYAGSMLYSRKRNRLCFTGHTVDTMLRRSVPRLGGLRGLKTLEGDFVCMTHIGALGQIQGGSRSKEIAKETGKSVLVVGQSAASLRHISNFVLSMSMRGLAVKKMASRALIRQSDNRLSEFLLMQGMTLRVVSVDGAEYPVVPIHATPSQRAKMDLYFAADYLTSALEEFGAQFLGNLWQRVTRRGNTGNDNLD